MIARQLGLRQLPYGANGLCNSIASNSPLLSTYAGGGGPSGCATGSAGCNRRCWRKLRGYAQPYWQSVTGNASDGVRDIPDVSLFAATGYWNHYYVVCWSDLTWGGRPVQRLSLGAGRDWEAPPLPHPSWPGFRRSSIRKPASARATPTPVYYALAAKEYGSDGSSFVQFYDRQSARIAVARFTDVTQGDTDVTCTGSINCYAPSGTNGVLSLSEFLVSTRIHRKRRPDFATGMGTVNAYNLVKNLAAKRHHRRAAERHKTRGLARSSPCRRGKITDGSGNGRQRGPP